MFSGNLPTKIANREKTVTRRTMKSESPPFSIGEVFYVRETWKAIGCDSYGCNWTIMFTDGTTKHVEHLFEDREKEMEFWQKWSDELLSLGLKSNPDGLFIFEDDTIEKIKWGNKLFMPKNAARTFLRVTEIREERLQSISESDAKREGVDIVNPRDFGIHDESRVIYRNYINRSKYCRLAKDSFRTLWISLHDEYSWKENPYIWVINFEKTEPK